MSRDTTFAVYCAGCGKIVCCTTECGNPRCGSCELESGGWVCSRECWDDVTGFTPTPRPGADVGGELVEAAMHELLNVDAHMTERVEAAKGLAKVLGHKWPPYDGENEDEEDDQPCGHKNLIGPEGLEKLVTCDLLSGHEGPHGCWSPYNNGRREWTDDGDRARSRLGQEQGPVPQSYDDAMRWGAASGRISAFTDAIDRLEKNNQVAGAQIVRMMRAEANAHRATMTEPKPSPPAPPPVCGARTRKENDENFCGNPDLFCGRPKGHDGHHVQTVGGYAWKDDPPAPERGPSPCECWTMAYGESIHGPLTDGHHPLCIPNGYRKEPPAEAQTGGEWVEVEILVACDHEGESSALTILPDRDLAATRQDLEGVYFAEGLPCLAWTRIRCRVRKGSEPVVHEGEVVSVEEGRP